MEFFVRSARLLWCWVWELRRNPAHVAYKSVHFHCLIHVIMLWHVMAFVQRVEHVIAPKLTDRGAHTIFLLFIFLYFFGWKILFCDFLTHVGPSLLCLLSWIATKAFSSYILLVVDYISRWTARAPSLPSLACALFTNIFYFDTTKQKNSIFKIKEIYGVYHVWNNSGLRYDCYVRRIIMTSRVDNSLKYVRVGSSK